MTRTLKVSSTLVLVAFVLTACNGDDDDDDTSRSTAPQDQFGTTFSRAFAADRNAEPIDPKPGDAGALTLTGEPINF